MNDFKKKLMSKNGKITMLLAKDMLTLSEGDRIKTFGQYAEAFNIGRGTVQSAIKLLQDEEAIKLESRGHLGTFIIWMDYKKLWSISDLGVIMGVMPLPYSRRYEGLATGLFKVFEKADIPFSLAFMRGASKRTQALNLDKYDFAIVSKLAASLEIRKSSDIEIIHEFSEGSYVKKHVVIFREKNEDEIRDGMRVAIDPMSIDQVILTSCECEGKNVDYIETSYSQIIQKMKNNEIDAAVWSGDEIEEKSLDFKVCPLNKPKSIELGRDDTIATIVVSKNNKEFAHILKRFIKMEEVEHIQKLVIDEKIIPAY
ncbi:GntR family transcriptional regulator YhfZ [Brassicibacter mesophilus]|uniref:GntR family transcriptional regulator YhfZ n=1 Tax=Brassicibacter mesophilus TaxID=745119 RepID=UPI003D23E3CF